MNVRSNKTKSVTLQFCGLCKVLYQNTKGKYPTITYNVMHLKQKCICVLCDTVVVWLLTLCISGSRLE